MKILFVVNQLFQAMVALQMKMTLYKNDIVDLLFINSSNGMDELYTNCKKSSLWHRVEIADKESTENKLEELKSDFLFITDIKCKYFQSFKYKPKDKYDLMFVNEFSYFSCLLWQYLHKNNKTKLYKFEEGYGSYLSDFAFFLKRTRLKYRLKDLFSSIFRCPQLLKEYNGCYYFQPDLVQFKSMYSSHSIPLFDFSNEEFKTELREMYNIPHDIIVEKKYIFFEENLLDEGIDDFNLIKDIANIVGKENIVVKLHPRRAKDRFSEYGIAVSSLTGVPWEAVLMNYDFTDKVIMTISSSIAFSSRLYFNQPLKTYMLYKTFDVMNVDKNSFLNYIDSFQKKYCDSNFMIPNSKDEFFNYLKKDIGYDR